MRGLVFNLVSTIILTFLFHGLVYAQKVPLPQSMAILGDSMSEALLADYSYEGGISNWEVTKMLRFGAVKDPKERLDKFRSAYAAPHKSWAGGFDESDLIFSHFERLVEHSPKLEAWNFAVSSAYSRDLKGQLLELFQLEEAQEIQFDYITLLIGANDLGAYTIEEMTSTAIFAGNVENTIRHLLETKEDRSILVINVPEILNIFEKTEDLIVRQLFGKELTCKKLRSTLYGKQVLFRSGNDEVYKKAHEVVRQYQSAMVNLVKRLSDEFPNAYLKVVQKLDPQQNARKLISVDCFHPSEWGQAELAQITWKNGFWPEL